MSLCKKKAVSVKDIDNAFEHLFELMQDSGSPQINDPEANAVIEEYTTSLNETMNNLGIQLNTDKFKMLLSNIYGNLSSMEDEDNLRLSLIVSSLPEILFSSSSISEIFE